MTTPEHPCISILVPIYNEGKTLAEVIRRVGTEAYGLEKEIILVDDGSRVAIRTIAAAPPAGITSVRIVTHERNCGKGAAVRSAIEQATGVFSVIQDADL